MLSSQRGGLCQLLSYSLTAPTPTLYTLSSVMLVRSGTLKTTLCQQLALCLGSPQGHQRETERLRQEKELALWCLLPLASVPHFTQQVFFTLAVAEPSCAAAESGLQLLQHLQNHPYCTPRKNPHQPPSIHSSHSSEVCLSAPWGPSSKFLSFNNTISFPSQPSPRADGCFLQLLLL